MIFEADHSLNLDDEIPSISNCRILVIDDSHLTCKLIKTRLEAEGISNIMVAYDGKEGLAKLGHFAPDLVILDIQMPVMDGREVLRLIRTKPKYDNLPIIIETALDGTNDREELVEMGATNIIAKPINHNLLAMRVRVHLEHQLLVKNLRNYRNRLSTELNLARRMQSDLLPTAESVKQIAENHGIRIESYYRPSSELGGDFWSITSLGDQQIAILMLDFAGHGISAAINTFRLSMILRDLSPLGKPPDQFIKRLNKELCRILGVSEFATAFYGVLNTKTRSFVYSAAGSPPPIICHAKTRDIKTGDSRGVPLGIRPDANYPPRQLNLDPGGSLILYSDAFPESTCRHGGAVGVDGVSQLVEAGFDDPISQARIEEFLRRFAATINEPPNDDMTMIWVQCP